MGDAEGKEQDNIVHGKTSTKKNPKQVELTSYSAPKKARKRKKHIQSGPKCQLKELTTELKDCQVSDLLLVFWKIEQLQQGLVKECLLCTQKEL